MTTIPTVPGFASLYAGKTVLAVGAHPDDIEIGIGGTVAKLKQAGARVIMAVACIPTQWETRMKEAENAAGILGGELKVLLKKGPARVEDVKTYELTGLIDELVKEFEPAAMFSHGPEDFHKDHVLVYNACLASQRLRFQDFFTYYPTSCRPALTSFQPQLFVDISKNLDTKMAAINAHPSQFEHRGLGNEFMIDLARTSGRWAGVQYAEGLEVVRMMLR